jgi:hypothetical protein
MNKTAIAPVVAAVCMFLGTITGHPIGQSVQDEATTLLVGVIALGTTIYGIWKDHHKK